MSGPRLGGEILLRRPRRPPDAGAVFLTKEGLDFTPDHLSGLVTRYVERAALAKHGIRSGSTAFRWLVVPDTVAYGGHGTILCPMNAVMVIVHLDALSNFHGEWLPNVVDQAFVHAERIRPAGILLLGNGNRAHPFPFDLHDRRPPGVRGKAGAKCQ